MQHPPYPSSTLAPDRGFTLIEVMVVVALLGILAAIAFPSYTDYIIRGRIPEATGRLAAQQVRMEQFFQDNRTYVGSNAGTLPCANDTTTSRYFDFDCTAAPTAAAFTLRATGKVSMAGFVYTVNQAGTKATTAVPAGWTLPNPNNCWIVRKGGQC